MAGLREKQKADRRRRILTASSLLFKQSGYQEVHINQIAECAEVSVGTFYNYFKTKADLLLSTVSMEVEEVLQQGDSILKDPPEDPVEALMALTRLYYDHSLVYLSKEMWRTAMAAAIQEGQSPFSIRYRELDKGLCTQVCGLLEVLQANGRLSADMDTRAMGEVIFNNLNAMFTEYSIDETFTLDELKDRVLRQTRAVVQPLIGAA